jgi:hypothetical protein
LPQADRKVSDIARIFECFEKKSFGVCPISVSGCSRNAERLGRVLMGHPSKITKFDQLGLYWRLRREGGKRLVDCQNFAGILFGDVASRFEVVPFQSAAALRSEFLPSSFDEDSPHSLSGRSEKVAAAVPSLGLLAVN